MPSETGACLSHCFFLFFSFGFLFLFCPSCLLSTVLTVASEGLARVSSLLFLWPLDTTWLKSLSHIASHERYLLPSETTGITDYEVKNNKKKALSIKKQASTQQRPAPACLHSSCTRTAAYSIVLHLSARFAALSMYVSSAPHKIRRKHCHGGCKTES